MRDILITGAAGFIGSNLGLQMDALNYSVSGFDNFSTGSAEHFGDFPIHYVDITDKRKVFEMFSNIKPYAVVHLAAQSAITTSKTEPAVDARTNIEGTINILEACRKYGTRRFIFSSTSAVYVETQRELREESPLIPQSPYGISKLSAENYVRYMMPDALIFRFGNVYGPRQVPVGENQVVARAIKHLLQGNEFSIVGNGRQKRDYIYVGDVVNAIIMGLEVEWAGTFNLSTGKSHSVNEVVWAIEKEFGVEGYNWKHTYPQDPRGDVYIDNRKLRRIYHTEYTSLENGINATANWWKTRITNRA